ncbi:peptide chain release factor N(5)-glutamine methyltransferase [Shewanella sp. D64]|uniref:peptide chain release factor N(5)-glutamine methyltransferase n=1 Tax=unclassified Shewanella TaxID=196818 RepID=UPI0022BA7040|nr:MULTISPECIES: peptide chain release factor N(5)-glutamine methyltransferase [unclassified Shewanella]MEC4728529.1 peptide chain release factor N(5)-glutamine methyltransferase [Shewanella sp. D64]MEC4740318.1 peptide chain release factor N(5)-glutamine methyltransferase [Shewanella sp. E94]WBJ94295.1 peptide chain release factor N(5)-glutamine methyltransferase [Shewanella sp. MTB7]
MYQTLSEALVWASPQLLDVSDTPKLDAEVMLLHIIHKQRGYLYTWPDERLTSDQIAEYTQMVARRVIGTPIAHIVGEREFWSLPFLVNPTTLIPRPDTEILVETALNLPLAETAKVLDLGTGTGVIALSLAYEKPQWQITAVDKIIEAVALAKANRVNLKLPQVEIVQSDWFDSICCYDFNLIVSNPPYIDEMDNHLEEGDVRFEPHSALTASEHGFGDLYHIAESARDYLAPGGYLLLEHGFEQAIQLRDKMIELGYENVATVRDFGSNDRCTLGRWPR